jgi:sensor histidine kinase YesM
MRFLSGKSPLKKILNTRVAYHICFWAFFLFLTLITPEKEGVTLSMKVMTGLRIVMIGIFPVYFHFFVLEKFFYRKKYVIYAALFISTVILYIYLFSLFFAYVFSEKFDYYSSAVFVFFIVLIATSLKVIKRSINERFLLQEIKAKQVQTELELLKTQINPHFLFNTLNNLYGMARKQEKATADGIARLSHLMRYMIHDSQVDRISLEKEVDQIKRLIELQKLRFADEDRIDINFKIEGQTKSVLIPPMLMIPFVENAFKHGISLQAPSFIHIHLQAEPETLQLSIKNSCHDIPSRKDEFNSGIGLQNVKRRLELLYPNSHELSTCKAGDVYEVNLVLENKKRQSS